MYYFDKTLLQQYIDSGAKLQIYYRSEWYNVTDMADLHKPKEVVGYDEYGEATVVPYKQIELIQVNGSVITRENLQTMMTGKKSEKDSETEKPSSPPSDEPEMEEPKEEEPKPKEKGPDLSWYSPHYDLGRLILKEYKKK